MSSINRMNICLTIGLAVLLLRPAPLAAGDRAPTRAGCAVVTEGPVQESVLYADGSVVEVNTASITRFVCAGDKIEDQVDGIERLATLAEASPDRGDASHVTGTRRAPLSGLDIEFVVTGSIPSGALEAISVVEAYIEGQFSDPVSLTINVEFRDFGSGSENIVGLATHYYVWNVDWSVVRAAWISDMDVDDVIQEYLPGDPDDCP